jgi:hypothetical protein
MPLQCWTCFGTTAVGGRRTGLQPRGIFATVLDLGTALSPRSAELPAFSAGTRLRSAATARPGARTRPAAGRRLTGGHASSSARLEEWSPPGGRETAPSGGSPPDGRLGLPATYPCTDKGRSSRPPRHVLGLRLRRFVGFARCASSLRRLRTPLRRLRRTPPRARGGSHPGAPERRATRRPRALPLPHASEGYPRRRIDAREAGPVA